MPRWLAILLCLAAALFGNACGAPAKPVQQPASADSAQPALLAALPGLSALAEPHKQLSSNTPGFYPLPLDDALGSAYAVPAAANLRLDADSGLAYAIYGVYGFDGDNGPVSAMVETGSLTGEYYVAFSNFVVGSWITAGPFSGNVEAMIPNPVTAARGRFMGRSVPEPSPREGFGWLNLRPSGKG